MTLVEVRDNAIHRAFQDPRNTGRQTALPWRIYGSCTTPVVIIKEKQIDHELHVRCRQCPGCVRARRSLWRMRAEYETMQSARTWFFTGTWRNQTSDLEEWGEEVTRWLKRVRKGVSKKGVSVRYLVVPEAHKSGMLHMHCLLHQPRESPALLTYRDIATPWKAGYHDLKLCDFRTAGYVTKYVTKDLRDSLTKHRPRIRSSQGYGSAIMERDPEELRKLLQNRPKEPQWEIWTKNLKQILRETQCQSKKAQEQRRLT